MITAHTFFSFETQNYGVSHADTEGLREVCGWPTLNLIHFCTVPTNMTPVLFSLYFVWSILIVHQTSLLYSLFLGWYFTESEDHAHQTH